MLALVSPPGAVAAAQGGSEMEVLTTTLPVGASAPTLEALQRSGAGWKAALAVRDKDTAAGQLPREAVLPAGSGLRKASRPSGMSDEMAGRVPLAATYPEPSRSMTKDECWKGLQEGRLFAVKSRYAMCAGMQFVQTWAHRGRPVGQSTFRLLVIETVPKKADRTIRVQYLFSDFRKSGTTKTSGLKVNTDGDVKMWPGSARKRYGGSVPPTLSFDQLKNKPEYKHTVLVEAGQGTGRDDVVNMAYEPFVQLSFPAPYVSPDTERVSVGLLVGRWDAAGYLFNKTGGGNPKKKGGAALPLVPTLPYSSKAGAPERAVALHLKDAHTKPGVTKPVNANKRVPGFDLNRPLHRLQHDARRYKANRSAAVATCVRYWGPNYATSVPGVPHECDEYPFASTYEGAAQSTYEPAKPKDNFSARPLPKTDNGAAGNILKVFMDRNRILDGYEGRAELDAYLVSIS
ncbi:hypothetical protein [Streptomyces sp. NPDC005017]|uniref:NucA/NucB deoxyribonuclease domain-containing protein n=1 Tax=Streptomyces sp. NPDC005017 TaxID=3364706 RepID=UPI00368DB4F8